MIFRQFAALALVATATLPLSGQVGVTHAGAHFASLPSFAGQWRLDVSRSRDLPPYYAAIREHRLDIVQGDSTLTVDVTLDDTAGVAQHMNFPYDLRHAVRIMTQVRTPAGPVDVPTTLTTTPRADGGLDIGIAREITMGGKVLQPGDRETWHLSPDGVRLLIDREMEMPGPRGMRTLRSHYEFVRR